MKLLHILQLNSQPNDLGFKCAMTTFSMWTCIANRGTFTPGWVWVWKPEVSLGCYLLCFLYFGDRCSHTPELAKSGRLACQSPQSSACLCLTVLGLQQAHHLTDIVCLGSGRQTQVLVLANQAFYPLSHLGHLLTPSEPPHFLCIIIIFVFWQRLAL